MKNSGKKIILHIINKLNGVAFKNSESYSEKNKLFFQERYEKVISLIPKITREDRGIEIGLSDGILAFSVKRIFNLYRLYTLEHPETCWQYSERFIEKLENENIVLQKVDLRDHKLPWRDGFFDFVILSEVIELPYLLKEMERILDYNGWLLITTPNISSLHKRINLFFCKNPISFGHIHEYTLNEIISLFDQSMFRIEKKGYFMIDTKRSVFTRIEGLVSKIIPSLGNNVFVIVRRR